MTPHPASQTAPDAVFETTIRPHRSLSRRGLTVLIIGICATSALVTTAFFLAGAWPVAGFSGVEICLAVALLRINARRANRRETITLTPNTLSVRRIDEHGRSASRQLRSAWLNVVLEERNARVPGLFLRNRTEQEEIAKEIGETEKRTLAENLKNALYDLRHPTFDNPQLREP